MAVERMTKLHFKFAEDANSEDRAAVLDALHDLGATGVEQLFPGEADPEFADLYVVSLPQRHVEDALHSLAGQRAVEFAEEAAERAHPVAPRHILTSYVL
jgi:hypothetical protein